MMATQTFPYDSSCTLDTPEEERAFLEEFLRDGDHAGIGHALGVVARARGMAALARDAGVPRESLHQIVDDDGRSDPGTVAKVLAALGVKTSVEA